MTTASGIRAGKAYVEVGANNAGLEAGLRRAEARVKAFGQGISSAGRALVGFGVGAAVPLGLATASFASFESAMARVKALTNATPEDFAALSAEAKRLGETTVYSASQAAQAMGVFALAGFKTNDIIKATGPALSLAAAGQMDLAQAADIAMKVMAGMGQTTDQLGYSIDVLAKAMTTANTDLVMLGDAFKFVGPIAKSAGVSFEEITAAIQLLSNAGIQGEMAGTTLRGAILSLASPSAEAKTALAKLGVQTLDAQGNFRSLASIVEDIQAGMAGLGKGEKLAILGQIFPDRQAAGFAELVAQGGVKLREYTENLKDAAGTGARIAGTQLDTLYGAWKLIESAVEGLAITIGEALNPILRDLGAGLVVVASVVTKWAKENKEAFQSILKGVVVAATLGAALLAVGAAVQVVGFAIGGLVTLVGTLTWAVGLLTSGFALLASPIGLAAVGLAGFLAYTKTGQSAVAGLGRAVQGLGETFRSMGQTFNQAWQGIVDAIKVGDFELAGQVAWAGMRVIWQKGVNWLSDLWRGFTTYFVEAYHKSLFSIARFFNNVWGGIEKVWFEGFALIARGWGWLMDFMRKTFSNVVNTFKVQWLAIQQIISPKAPQEFVKQLADLALESLKEKEKIDLEREAANKEIEKQRQDIETRRLGVEGGLLDQQIRERNERRASRERASAAEAAALVGAEKELADAVKKAADAVANAQWEKSGSWFGDFPDRKLPTPEGVANAARQATGIGPGETAGTFDAAMLRFLGGTGNDSMERERARKQQEQIDLLKKMVDLLTRGVAGAVFN